jgi:hypothetical protein
VAAGGGIPVAERLDLAIHLEYRGRYYHLRGGEPLADNIDQARRASCP